MGKYHLTLAVLGGLALTGCTNGGDEIDNESILIISSHDPTSTGVARVVESYLLDQGIAASVEFQTLNDLEDFARHHQVLDDNVEDAANHNTIFITRSDEWMSDFDELNASVGTDALEEYFDELFSQTSTGLEIISASAATPQLALAAAPVTAGAHGWENIDDIAPEIPGTAENSVECADISFSFGVLTENVPQTTATEILGCEPHIEQTRITSVSSYLTTLQNLESDTTAAVLLATDPAFEDYGLIRLGDPNNRLPVTQFLVIGDQNHVSAPALEAIEVVMEEITDDGVRSLTRLITAAQNETELPLELTETTAAEYWLVTNGLVDSTITSRQYPNHESEPDTE